MERLTRKMPGGRYGLMEGKELGTVRNNRAVIDRLAAYEDTGLEPEEIVALRASFQELKKEAVPLVRAKIEERLVMLPCKVGDTVYRVVTKKKYLNNPKNAMYIKEIVIKPENFHKYIHEIGKTVFLTREEAEAALGAKKGESCEANL